MTPDSWNEYFIGDIALIQVGRDLKEERFSEEKTETHIYPVYSNTVENFGLYGFYDCKEYADHSVTVVGRGAGLGTAFSRKTGFGAIGRLLVVSPIDKSFDVDYLANYINFSLTIHHENGGIPQLPGATFAKYKVLLPPIREQIKIAEILSVWDKTIAATEHLLANSHQQKAMLTSLLLTGQKRFSQFVKSKEYQRTLYGSTPSDWHYVTIAEIANQQSRINSTQNDLPVLSCSKYDGLVDSLKYFKKKVYSDDTSKYRVVEFGDFAYPSNHIEEGSIGYQDVYPAGIVSPIYTVFRTNDTVDDYFLYRTLKTDQYRQIFSAATSASVDRRGSLRWKEFSKIRVPLPPLAEQQKIASVLSTADAEIRNLKDQLEKLKIEKKALMQQLLTGQRRVKLDEEVAA